MKQVVWHVSRDLPARIKITPPILVNSAWASVFEKHEHKTSVVIPTELAMAVNLGEIKKRLVDWYRREVGRNPGFMLTVYRYPAGVAPLEGAIPIGVGLAACEEIHRDSLSPGRVEWPEDPSPSASTPEPDPSPA